MHVLAFVAGIGTIVLVLLDAFETIVLPRRVSRPFRLTTLFYRYTWRPWRAIAKNMSAGRRRESFLGFFGPFSLLALLMVWAICLVLGFAFMHWGLGPKLTLNNHSTVSFLDTLYMSGSTFFTLGLGDVLPSSLAAKVLTLCECALGLGFLALIIGYLPVIYQSFSERERAISLLDARAGSPPTAYEVLRRALQADNAAEVVTLLREFEGWAASILESHISYPVLCLYRSQHDNQSWLSALVTILDVSALAVVGVERIPSQQAMLTYAMARHTLVDLTQIFNTPPIMDGEERLSDQKLEALRKSLSEQGVTLREDPAATEQLKRMRAKYEPHAKALADYLLLKLPPFQSEKPRKDNWQTSAWKQLEGSAEMTITEQHF